MRGSQAHHHTGRQEGKELLWCLSFRLWFSVSIKAFWSILIALCPVSCNSHVIVEPKKLWCMVQQAGLLKHGAATLQEDIPPDLLTAEFDAMESHRSAKRKMTAILSASRWGRLFSQGGCTKLSPWKQKRHLLLSLLLPQQQAALHSVLVWGCYGWIRHRCILSPIKKPVFITFSAA